MKHVLTVKSLFQQLFPNRSTRVLLTLYVLTLLWWLTIFGRGIMYTTENYLFGAVQIVIPFFGAMMAIFKYSKKNSNPVMKKVVLLMSGGLLFWSIGSVVFVYYNIILHIEAPYPSLADFAYFQPPLLWIIALIYLTKLIGVEKDLRHVAGRIVFFAMPIIATAISFYLLFVVARDMRFDFSTNPIKLFFDFSYPIFDLITMVILSLLIFGLFFRKVSSMYIVPVSVIIAAFVFHYLADLSFSFTTTKEIYFAGIYVDLLFTTSTALIALGVNLFGHYFYHESLSSPKPNSV